MVDLNQSDRVACDNCGTVGGLADEQAENTMGEMRPVLECPTCRARWTTNQRLADLFEIAELIAETTAARGIDLYATRQFGISNSDWAEMTGRDQSTVARNVRRGTE